MKKRGPFTRSFVNMVNKYRDEHSDVSFEKLADKIGISTGQFWNYYNGKNDNPGLDNLKKLHDFFNVSYSYLAGEVSFTDNDSAELLKDEIGNIKTFAMNYDRTYVIDSIIRNMKQMTEMPAFWSIKSDGKLEKELTVGGDSIRGENIVISTIDGAGDIFSAMVKTRDKVFQKNTDHANAMLVIDQCSKGVRGLEQDLFNIVGQVAANQDVYSDLDAAVTNFKKRMNDAMILETERIKTLIEKRKEGES